MKKISNLLFIIFLVFISLSRVDAITLEKKEISLASGESKNIPLTENLENRI